MSQILNYIKDNIIIPFLKFLATLLFIGLLYSGYYFYKLKYTCEIDEVQAKKDGWILIHPGDQLPAGYSRDTYEIGTLKCYGEVFIQIRKK